MQAPSWHIDGAVARHEMMRVSAKVQIGGSDEVSEVINIHWQVETRDSFNHLITSHPGVVIEIIKLHLTADWLHLETLRIGHVTLHVAVC